MSIPEPILDELQARGLVQDVTAKEELAALLGRPPMSFYTGFDPTGASLHAGNLVPITLMRRLQRAGHKPFALVGGATGMIGDPSGKSEERQLLDRNALEANVAAIGKQLARFLDFDDPRSGAVMVNNFDWFRGVGYIDFLRDVGKHLTVNYMMAKESVRARLEDRDQGISYTEFSYMLLQAYDFHVLASERGVRLQAGGSDQWGNITAGIELHRKLGGKEPLFGMTTPLLLDSKGEKMGKTAAGTKIWLDAERTSPYAFYQYWLNVADEDVERLLKLFVPDQWDYFATTDQNLQSLLLNQRTKPESRIGQHFLARYLTEFVHGRDAMERANKASVLMFGEHVLQLEADVIESLLADVPWTDLPRAELDNGVALVDLLVRTSQAQSKGAARRLISQGGVYVNNKRVAEDSKVIGPQDLGAFNFKTRDGYILFRAGKKNYHIVKVK